MNTRNSFCLFFIITMLFLTGCASVPLGSEVDDQRLKQFDAPPSDKSGLYVYRNSHFGAALKKSLYIDGEFVGESAPYVYFYKLLPSGKHILSTESEFSNNDLVLEMDGGKNYYVNQYIRIGAFVGGANLELVDEKAGREGVLECKLAKDGLPDPETIEEPVSNEDEL